MWHHSEAAFLFFKHPMLKHMSLFFHLALWELRQSGQTASSQTQDEARTAGA